MDPAPGELVRALPGASPAFLLPIWTLGETSCSLGLAVVVKRLNDLARALWVPWSNCLVSLRLSLSCDFSACVWCTFFLEAYSRILTLLLRNLRQALSSSVLEFDYEL